MAEDNEQVVRRAYKVAEDEDLAGWVAAFTDDGRTGRHLRAPLVDVGHHHPGAAGGQPPGRRGADAVGAAGDQGHGAVEVDGHQGSCSPAVTGVRCSRSSPRSRASMAMTARPTPEARSAITSE